MNTTKDPSTRKRKVAAIAAGALVIGVGAAYTLATWNDSEWVFGEATTSSFNVEQNVTNAFINEPAEESDPAVWTSEEANPGGILVFGNDALAVVPGEPIYAPVALRTAELSEEAEITLQAAEPAETITAEDASSPVWQAIDVQVYTATAPTPPTACTAAGMEDPLTAGWTLVPGITTLDTPADGVDFTQTLAADSDSIQHYCFELTLNTDGKDPGVVQTQLQGKTIAPAWEFAAESTGVLPTP